MDKETEMSQVDAVSSYDRQSEAKEDSGHFEEVAPQRQTFAQKLKQHLRKWWWLHLILFIAITLLLVLLLVYVAFPKIAQNGIDDSSLLVTSIVLSNPSETAFHLHQVSTSLNDSPYHPHLDAFNASLALEGNNPYTYVTIPAIDAEANSTVIVDQDVAITDLKAFTDYNIALLQNEKINIAIQGSTSLHEMKFPTTTVNFNKVVTINGLNKLSGFNITSINILLKPLPDGTNMAGTVSIPNASPITFSMGNVIMDVLHDGTRIGTSTLPDLTLYPGENIVNTTSVVNQTTVLTLITTTYHDGMIPLDFVGTSSVFDGVHLTYFEEALKSVTQHVVLDAGKALSAIGLNITGS
ncbi:hypothetical protein MMC30_001455 [Trapelia coarctata]|nr:hypothetical protein [Trapelia coarctata]